jgi:hypothetical protein
MRKLLLLLLGLTAPAWATWSVKQTNNNSGCSSGSTTCTISTSATGGGRVLVMDVEIPNTGITITGVSGGGESWQNPSCSVGVTGFSIDSWYALASTAGITSYTVTVSSAPTAAWNVHIGEVATTLKPVFDTCASRTQSSTVTSIAAPTITLSGSNDYISQYIYEGGSGGSASSIDSSYTIEQGQFTTHAYADKVNTTSTPPTWTVSVANTAILIALAFKEAGTVGIIQMTNCGTGAATTCTAAISSTTAGNLLVISAENNTLSSVTDSSTGSCPGTAVDTFTHVTAADAGTNNIQTWYAKNIAGGATAVCLTFSGGFDKAWVFEVQGLSTTSPIGPTAATGGSPSSMTCPSVTTTVAGGFILSTTITQGGSGQAVVQDPFAAQDGSTFGSAAFLITTATGTYSATWTKTSATGVACSVVAFQTAAAAKTCTMTLLGAGPC